MILLQNKNDYKEVLAREGVKNTKHRNAILGILEQSKTPVTAEEIFLSLKENHTSIWLSTVYRTLEILTSKELVVKSTIMGHDKARYEFNHNEHKHHVICVCCQKMISFLDCPIEEYEKNLKEKIDFIVTGHKLEIYGYCQECSKLIK
ncbi:MAG: Fur family transcriptional regulator [Desulfitobacteriaceae bacterium]